MEKEIEIWKDIKDYEGLYQISSWGRLKTFNYSGYGGERILDRKVNSDGYKYTQLCKNGFKKYKLIHRLVALHFTDYNNHLPIVRHLDNNPINNHYLNLAWGTSQDNSDDMTKAERQCRGINQRDAKLSEIEVLEIRDICKKDNVTLKEVALKYNISKGHVSNIKYRRVWKHI